MPRADRPPVRWDESGTPHSTAFNDIYRSQSPAGGGLAQAREVFLRGCGLLGSPPAWCRAPTWTILETGFGLGLNALAAWQAWRDDPHRPERLHLVSIESHPVRASDLLQSVAAWPALQPLAQQLAKAWWGMGSGLHRLSFEGGRVCLTLVIAPIEELATPQGLAGLDVVADSVFLDGFNPKVNPAMWSLATLQAICAHTREGTRLASWCVATPVRDTLASLGLAVSREPGLAPKRHRLEAMRTAPATARRQARTRPERVWVLGAGLAGAALAREWADRGVPVRVLEARPGPAQAASGLPVGLFAPHGARQRPELRELTLAGLRHMHALAERCLERGTDWSPSGVVEQLMPDRRGKWPPQPSPEDDTITVQAGLPGHDHASLWHAHAGWIKPKTLVHALLDHPLIECQYGADVARVARTPHGLWQALGVQDQVLAEAPWAGLAAGAGSIPLLTPHLSEGTAGAHPASGGSQSLGLHAVRGQVSLVPMSALADAGLPEACVNGHGSWIPHMAVDGGPPQGVFGSGFDHQRLDDSVHEADHHDNLRRLSELFPTARLQAAGLAPWRGWSGVRCTSPDRLPWCGPWPQADQAPGLWVLTALGARGLTLGALLAHALVCEALGEPSPIHPRCQQALRPGRASRR